MTAHDATHGALADEFENLQGLWCWTVLTKAMVVEALRAYAPPDEKTAQLLAAISVASIQNTRESAKDRIGKDNPYWTDAYGDVCIAVDREMAQRERAEAAENTPSETPQKPVDPESEAANPVWDLVIEKCHSAYPEREGMQWGESPLELITEIINERDEARAALYEIKHVAYHFLESGEERVSDSEVAFDLPNEDYDKLVALLGDAHPEPGSSALSAIRESELPPAECYVLAIHQSIGSILSSYSAKKLMDRAKDIANGN